MLAGVQRKGCLQLSRFGVQGLGFWVWGFGFRVEILMTIPVVLTARTGATVTAVTLNPKPVLEKIEPKLATGSRTNLTGA